MSKTQFLLQEAHSLEQESANQSLQPISAHHLIWQNFIRTQPCSFVYALSVAAFKPHSRTVYLIERLRGFQS